MPFDQPDMLRVGANGSDSVISQKLAFAPVLEERKRFVLDGGVPDVGTAVVVDVLEVGAHAGDRIGALRVSDAALKRDFLESLAADVVEQEVRHGCRWRRRCP